jgi:hypothetical protein
MLAKPTNPAEFEKLIPVYEQVIYINSQMPADYRFDGAQQSLDRIVAKARGTPRNKICLQLADEAYARHDWRGAIVEYGRYLSNATDSAAQLRLIESRLRERQKILASQGDSASQYMNCLRKLKHLEEEDFGANDPATTGTSIDLVETYLKREDLANAEQELDGLWRLNEKGFLPFAHFLTETVPPPPDANENRSYFRQARILWLKCKLDLHKANYKEAMHDLEWIAYCRGKTTIVLREFFAAIAEVAGRYDLAADQLGQSVQAGTDFQGSRGAVPPFEPLIMN